LFILKDISFINCINSYIKKIEFLHNGFNIYICELFLII